MNALPLIRPAIRKKPFKQAVSDIHFTDFRLLIQKEEGDGSPHARQLGTAQQQRQRPSKNSIYVYKNHPLVATTVMKMKFSLWYRRIEKANRNISITTCHHFTPQHMLLDHRGSRLHK
ncbi:hypothetical protein NPIL_387841 [Nephila pilipes]|uniref:Uncharacterized protein n=1 Tax=Nephila pilipes TaxID=299642 RepID=A0A8X6UCS5_NEPPI|nr:hypothetical protein NPIL_387841 [Nephila pilipes]